MNVDARSHARVVVEFMRQARTPRELLLVLLDLYENTQEPDRFSRILGVSTFDDREEWMARVLEGLIDCTDKLLRRGPVPVKTKYFAPPDAGTMWMTPDQKCLLVVGSCLPGFVFCAPMVNRSWRLEYLVVYASADFGSFQSFRIVHRKELQAGLPPSPYSIEESNNAVGVHT